MQTSMASRPRWGWPGEALGPLAPPLRPAAWPVGRDRCRAAGRSRRGRIRAPPFSGFGFGWYTSDQLLHPIGVIGCYSIVGVKKQNASIFKQHEDICNKDWRYRK